MAIGEHPDKGSILWCDFDRGFIAPEMVKRRPVIVISPKIAARAGLCTVVALSTTAPNPVMQYHAQIDLLTALPAGLQSAGLWIKGDMVNTVGLHRLDFIRTGRNKSNKRTYYYSTITNEQMKLVKSCILRALGLATLTKYL